MLGQAPWARLSPSGSAILLLALWDLRAPVLQMNSRSALPGTRIFLQCILPVVSPVRRIIFCKDGIEAYSLKAQQGQLNYSVVLNITSRSAGRYRCGYQEWNELKHRRSSALSAGRNLDVPGAAADVTTQDICSSPGNVVSFPASPSPPAPHAWLPHALPTGTALAVAAVGLILVSAGSWFAIRKGACRGRCPSAQDSSADPSHFYANVDEMGRVKVSSAPAQTCRLSVHVMVARVQAVGEQMQAKSASDGRSLGALRGCALAESPSFHAPSISPWWAP
nr:uncharacterized protein LOC113840886 isoform X2 [Anas platyrhynchos]